MVEMYRKNPPKLLAGQFRLPGTDIGEIDNQHPVGFEQLPYFNECRLRVGQVLDHVPETHHIEAICREVVVLDRALLDLQTAGLASLDEILGRLHTVSVESK